MQIFISSALQIQDSETDIFAISRKRVSTCIFIVTATIFVANIYLSAYARAEETPYSPKATSSQGVNNILGVNRNFNFFPHDAKGNLLNGTRNVTSSSTDDSTAKEGDTIVGTTDNKEPIAASTEQLNPVRSPTKFHFDPSTPQEFRSMVEHLQQGNYADAKVSAGEFVSYLSELMFMVREVTHLIIEAMIEQGIKTNDDYEGVEQMLDWQMAQARSKSNLPIKPTHDKTLARIKVADPEGKAEVLFFFALNCRYCRDMSADLERVSRALKNDHRVTFTGMLLGSPPDEWIKSYQDYTGLRIPIAAGDSYAKALRISFLPTLVVISPGNKVSYMRTGQQSFEHMYEFIRTVQGESKAIHPAILREINRPIGEMERLKPRTITVARGITNATKVSTVGLPARTELKDELTTF